MCHESESARAQHALERADNEYAHRKENVYRVCAGSL